MAAAGILRLLSHLSEWHALQYDAKVWGRFQYHMAPIQDSIARNIEWMPAEAGRG